MTFVTVPGTEVEWCEHETRVRDYAAFCRATGREAEQPDFPQSGDHPVVNVNWHDARAFCEWLGAREGRRYRLPTDREWSVAAGLGETEREEIAPGRQPAVAGLHHWGRGPLRPGAGNFCDECFGKRQGAGYEARWLEGFRDGYAATAPVGRFRAGPCGLRDFAGNVWEWCEDWYDPATKRDKVVRGGAWRTGDSARLLASFRGPDPPSARIDSIGFRVVRERQPLTFGPRGSGSDRSR